MIDEIKIIEVRVRNFRCLKAVDVFLDKLTVLIGRNNSGKTSFLDAMNFAIGDNRYRMLEEDIFLDHNENQIPKDRQIIIDLLIFPWDFGKEERKDSFQKGSFWLNLWGNGVSQDKEDRDFVGIRTLYKWNEQKDEYQFERKFLSEWNEDSSKIFSSRTKEREGAISSFMIDPLSLYYMDEKRDMKEEFKKKTSFWYKLTTNLGLKKKAISDIETQLNKLNSQILDQSDVLLHLIGYLQKIYPIISHEKGDATLNPIPRQFNDLSKGIDISILSENNQTFSLSRYGTGTRSIATIIVFYAYMVWKQKNKKNAEIHSMLAIEEPENHLHPQAQTSLINLIKSIPGQVIITTHSPEIVRNINIAWIRHFINCNSNTFVSELDTTDLSNEDIRKIDRMVINTRGYMLYARALIFFEGETEEQAIPMFAKSFWSQIPTELGIEMIGVGGKDSYLPFLRLAKSFQIPWYIFSDGEPEAISAIDNALGKLEESLSSDNSKIFIIPDGKDFESYLICQEYQQELIEMIINIQSTNAHHRKNKEKEWHSKSDPILEITNKAKKNKTKYAKPIAQAILDSSDPEKKIPQKIKELFLKISSDLNIKIKE